jgi:FKBP-type peptidyl-prolyl cis-trans isomerase FkpA
MKKSVSVLMALVALLFAVGCNKVNYRKTESGLTYQLFPGNSKDSTIRDGNIIKMNIITKLNDSVMYNSFDEVPAFWQYYASQLTPYNLMEILPLMRTGDSAITVQMIDTLIAKGAKLPPGAKKGDRIVTHLSIIHVYRSEDSVMRADYEANRLLQVEKMTMKRDAELEKSGEIAKELRDMDAYLKANSINAQKTGKGTYVRVDEQGTGRQAENGKYVKVKYTGKLVENDSTFESGVYPFQLGRYSAIRGWDEGILLFKEGGKGTLYIPGFLAYGDNPNSAFKPFAALKFDIELLEVSDSPISPDPPQTLPQKN